MIGEESGQASIELVAGLPALLLAALVALQLLAAGYALTIADGAAEAGALSLASGRPAEAAVRSALPGWARTTSPSPSGVARSRSGCVRPRRCGRWRSTSP